MSFYLNMLREEEELMGNTGFDADAVATPDDKYAVELKDVAQAVEDLNDARAEESSQDELDGQDLNEDPVAECMIVMYESEHNWNAIMQAIAVKELNEASRGREMVMEAVDIKGFIDKAKQFFVKMFKKITGIVKNWISNASAVFRTNKSFVQKYGKDLPAGKAAYEKAANSKQFKGYKFGDTSNVQDFIAAQKQVNANTQKVVSELTRQINSGAESFNAVSSLKADVDGFRSNLCGNRNGSVSADEFRKKLKAAYFGSEEKVTLNGKYIEAKYLVDVLSKDNSDIKNVKSAYKAVEDGFRATLKALNDLEKALKGSGEKGSYGSERSAAMMATTSYITAQKEMKNASSLSLTTMLKAIRSEKAQARRIANAYMFALNKGKRKGSGEEEKKGVSEGGFLSSVELI